MSSIDKQTKEKMLEDLKKFLQDSTSAKNFSECMSESNSWLEKQGK